MLNSKEIKEVLTLPYIRKDLFFTEVMINALYIMEGLIEGINKRYHKELDINECKQFIMQEAKTFHNHCHDCKQECAENYRRKMNKGAYKENGIEVSGLPKEIAKETYGNYYMLELAKFYAFCAEDYLSEKGYSEGIKQQCGNEMFAGLIPFYKDQCIGNCNYYCFKTVHNSAYCDICMNLDDDLPCPLKNECTFEEIEDDFYECKKRL